MLQVTEVLLDLREEADGRQREPLRVGKHDSLLLLALGALRAISPLRLGFCARLLVETGSEGFAPPVAPQLLVGVQQLADGGRVAQAEPHGQVHGHGRGGDGPRAIHLEKPRSKEGVRRRCPRLPDLQPRRVPSPAPPPSLHPPPPRSHSPQLIASRPLRSRCRRLRSINGAVGAPAAGTPRGRGDSQSAPETRPRAANRGSGLPRPDGLRTRPRVSPGPTERDHPPARLRPPWPGSAPHAVPQRSPLGRGRLTSTEPEPAPRPGYRQPSSPCRATLLAAAFSSGAQLRSGPTGGAAQKKLRMPEKGECFLQDRRSLNRQHPVGATGRRGACSSHSL